MYKYEYSNEKKNCCNQKQFVFKVLNSKYLSNYNIKLSTYRMQSNEYQWKIEVIIKIRTRYDLLLFASFLYHSSFTT